MKDQVPLEDDAVRPAPERSNVGLPPSSELKGYEALLPGATDRILTLAEEHFRHRLEIEKMEVEAQVELLRDQAKRANRGQAIATGLAIGCMSSGIYLATTGHDTVASIVFGSTILGLVSIFALGKLAQGRFGSGEGDK